MSYFMTINGMLTAECLHGARLVPAEQAQPYIAKLGNTLAEADGAPVVLVNDGVSGTSDGLVSELVSALVMQERIEDLALYGLLRHCFEQSVGFRLWWAGDVPAAHLAVANVEDLPMALNALATGRGIRWLANAPIASTDATP